MYIKLGVFEFLLSFTMNEFVAVGLSCFVFSSKKPPKLENMPPFALL